MRIRSNAKINLSLKVIGIKENLHLIESIIAPISIYDEIEINDSNEFEIEGMDLNKKDNIMYKAVMLMKERYLIEKNIKIKIKKNIPMMAGLGGGSSNAAFIINYLNKYWNIGMNKNELINFAKEIGSDVSFFIINKPAFISGTGEIIKEISINKIKGLLVFDNDFSSTKDVYKNIDNYPYSKQSGQEDIEYVNDLEKGLSDLNKIKIKEIKNDFLNNKAEISLMSGSGGSVFGIYSSEDDLNKAYQVLKEKYFFVEKFESL